MTSYASLSLLLLLCVSLGSCQRNFRATVQILEDATPATPGASKNIYDAELHYDYDNKLMKIQYKAAATNTALNGFTEIWDYNAKVLYKQPCATCEAFKSGGFMPEFFAQEPQDRKGGQPLQQGNRVCEPFTKTNPVTAGNVETVWIHVPNPRQPTVGVSVCAVQFTAASGGRRIIFEAPSGTAGSFSHANCAPKCGAPLDLTFVIDESGSINPTEWNQMNTFIKGVIDQFEVGPDKTHVGIAYFAGISYSNSQDPANCCGLAESALPLSSNRANVNAVIDNHQKKGGHTCINCGVRAAQRYYPNPERNTNHRQVMIVVTDGYNNRETNYFRSDIDAARAHAGGITTFAVGVANSDADQLAYIAGGDVTRVFREASFDALVANVKNIADKICEGLQDVSPCGPDCKGPCTCARTCACPSRCSDPSPCEKGECPNAATGCRSKVNTCAPADGTCPARNTCDAPVCVARDTMTPTGMVLAGACATQPIDCNDNNPCTVDSCQGGHCQHKPRDCGSDRCQTQRCVAGQCVVDPATIVACPARDRCEVGICTPQHGTCSFRRVVCDDGNPCTTDTCQLDGTCSNVPIAACNACVSPDPCTPNVWQNGQCVPGLALASPGQQCDDRDPCTIDTCRVANGRPVCDHAARVCEHPEPGCKKNVCRAAPNDPAGFVCAGDLPKVDCDDGNVCTTDRCVEATGTCNHAPVPCVSVDGCSCPVCDPVRGCQLVPINCDDNNQCTEDVCVAGKCVHNPKPCAEQADKCRVLTCDPVRGCVSNPFDCSKVVPSSTCHKIECRTVNGAARCMEFPLAGLVDACGRCKSANTPCIRGNSSAAAAGLATGLVIVSALVGGALAIAIGACLAARAATGPGVASGAPAASASVNPLYESDQMSFDNPLAQSSIE